MSRKHEVRGPFLVYNIPMSNLFNSKPKQLKLPLDVETLIPVSDIVYSFCEIIDCLDLSQYVDTEENYTGRPKYNQTTLLKVVLFSFMENGYLSLRKIEKSCKTDIRYMYLLDGMKVPSYVSIGSFINSLKSSVQDIFLGINKEIFKRDSVDLNHTYIDGTKIEANANKYTWVWKKSCVKNRDKTFEKITDLINRINAEDLKFFDIKFETRSEYAVEYLDLLLTEYRKFMGLNPKDFKHGKGHRKSLEQKNYELLEEYKTKLLRYTQSINICGDTRNSYSKTDKDATFMRVKKDYMGNDQLLPAYNMQIAVCDEYIAVIDAKQYASDMDCFVPLMEKFNSMYGKYPKYPVADAGYGSYNNYIYCEEHGMEKYMKFTMFEKETKDKKYQENPYRAVNFKRNNLGDLVCPNGKKFNFKCNQAVKGNKYGRTEEVYECEDCLGCEHKEKCCPRAKYNRTIRVNRELTQAHEEVLENLCSIQGALLCMNRSIQAEGTFGVMKWDKAYTRAFRKGIESVILEFTLISCGFNLYKYHNKKQRIELSIA